MELNRAILVLVMAAVITLCSLPCSGAKKDPNGEGKKEDIWVEGEPRGPGRGLGRGPRRFELTDEEIDRVMKALKESDPAKAKELAELRARDPNQFQAELIKHGSEEVGKIMRDRRESWRRRRQAEFLEWLQKNYRREAEELEKLKQRDPDLYVDKFDLTMEKYRPIWEAVRRRNTELAEVLKEDLALKERRDELLRAIKVAKSEKEKKELTGQLQVVVSRRYDLIVKQKEMAYEGLLRWLKELQNRINKSRAEIANWKDEKIKADNVKQRLKDLTEGSQKMNWD